MIALSSPTFRRSAIVILVAAGLLLFVPLIGSNYVVHVVTISFYYVILAASWNLLAGYTGQFSLAHHAFAAVGAYTSGLLGYHWGVSAWLGIPAGALLAGAMGYGLGRLVLRMRTIYLAIATWAFAETVHVYLTADYTFTRGELGLSVKSLYGTLNPTPYYFTFLGLTVLVLLGLRMLIDSPIGYFMRAIKDDELRAKSLGIDTTRVKVVIFSLSSAIAGLVSKPVIAVPTSVGYGASFGGLAALLGMLNSCGSGVTVVNIDNGFGAAYAAATINRQLHLARAK